MSKQKIERVVVQDQHCWMVQIETTDLTLDMGCIYLEESEARHYAKKKNSSYKKHGINLKAIVQLKTIFISHE